MNHPHRDQSLIDALQAAIPLVQLMVSSAARQHDDAARVLDHLGAAVELLRPPSPDRPKARHLPNLDAAIVRSGRTLAEVGFLIAVSEARLKHLCAGADPTPEEVSRLTVALPDWLPKTPGGAR